MTPILPAAPAGGSGTRLRPPSRALYPKQFLALTGGRSMMRETLLPGGGLRRSRRGGEGESDDVRRAPCRRVRREARPRGEAEPGFALAEDVCAALRRRIAPYKAPHSVEFTDALPKSPVGKPLRRDVQQPSFAGG